MMKNLNMCDLSAKRSRRLPRSIGFHAACGILFLLSISNTWAGRHLDPSDPVDNMRIEIGMGCRSTNSAEPHYYFWTGKVFSRRAGEPDRHLFNVQGVNPRACRILNDPGRGGQGYRSAARELMLYLDPESNEILSSWENPWTGESVEVAHMFNDPANTPPKFPLDEEGRPAEYFFVWKDLGDYLISRRTRRSFRENPMGGDYQSYVGGHYHTFEVSNMVIHKDSIARQGDDLAIPYVVTWTRISPWLPWMKMGSRDGGVVLTSNGRGSQDFEELPQPLRGAIESTYPLAKSAPDVDDSRPFVTSWDSMKRWINDRRGDEKREP